MPRFPLPAAATRVTALASAVILALGASAVAQSSTTAPTGPATPAMPKRLLPDAPTAPQAEQGELFSSIEAGLALRLPPGRQLKGEELGTDAHLLAAVVNETQGWRFEVRRLPLSTPIDIASVETPQGGQRRGLLDLLAEEEAAETQGTLLRKDPVPLGDADAGVYAVYYTIGLTPRLKQRALIKAGDTLYYDLSLVSPAPEDATQAELAQDARVKAAVEAFSDALNSFEALDQTELRREQDQRLYRTRALFVNLTRPRLMQALQPEQWWRIRRNGQDIGYSYVVEEPATALPDDRGDKSIGDPATASGVRVGIRTRLTTPDGQIDRESWAYAGVELKEEDFREQSVISVEGEPKTYGMVIGMMRYRQVPKKVRIPRPGGLGHEEQIEIVDDRRLEVNYSMEHAPVGDPLTRQLPAWYIPQAIEHLLPRLVAPWGTRNYLVAVYDPARREIWQKYVDVEGLKNENVGGETQLVMVVSIRKGLSGPKTRHFVHPETYQWLGSINEETGVEVWPADPETLQEIWQDPDLTRPSAQPEADQGQ